jgi:hypothetical protein
VVFTQRKKAPRAATYIIAVLVAAILGLQGWNIISDSGPPGGGLIEEFHEAAGWKLGQYLAERYPDAGEILVIQAVTREGTPVPSAPLQLAGIEKAFEGAGRHVNALSMSHADAHQDPMMMGGPVARNDAFVAAVESAPNADAVICCINLPYLQSDPPDDLPPLFLLETGDRLNCQGLIAAGVAQGAVERRLGVGRGAKPKRGLSPEEIFALRYELLTASGE